MTAKLCAIGNSKGIRIPQRLIARYHLADSIIIEEHDGGILIKSAQPKKSLSWEDTFKEMAQEQDQENWADLEGTIADGL